MFGDQRTLFVPVLICRFVEDRFSCLPLCIPSSLAIEIWGFLVSISSICQVALALQTWHLRQHGFWGFKSSSLLVSNLPIPKLSFSNVHIYLSIYNIVISEGSNQVSSKMS